MRLGRSALRASHDHVIPIVGRWSQAVDHGVKGNHLAGRRIPRLVGVEPAVDRVVVSDQRAEPSRIGSDARRGDADAIWKQLVATYRIDRRLTKHDVLGVTGANPEVSQVLEGAGCHATPSPRSSAT